MADHPVRAIRGLLHLSLWETLQAGLRNVPSLVLAVCNSHPQCSTVVWRRSLASAFL